MRRARYGAMFKLRLNLRIYRYPYTLKLPLASWKSVLIGWFSISAFLYVLFNDINFIYILNSLFQGKICSHPLRVHSTFNDPMVIEDIISLPPDKRISSKHSGHILARATKVIGHLYLNPNIECNNECYTGLQHDTTGKTGI